MRRRAGRELTIIAGRERPSLHWRESEQHTALESRRLGRPGVEGTRGRAVEALELLELRRAAACQGERGAPDHLGLQGFGLAAVRTRGASCCCGGVRRVLCVLLFSCCLSVPWSVGA